MENWINFDNLPRRKDGKISWKDCDHNMVEFSYNGNLDSLMVINRATQDAVNVCFKENSYIIPIISLQRVSLGKLYNFAVKDNYHYNADDIIIRDNEKLEIKGQIRIIYGNKQVKGYDVSCSKCDNIFKISESNLDRGDGCPYCSSHKVQIGVNDLWTTRHDVACMLSNPQDGYNYSEFSNVLLNFTCPICGKEIGLRYLNNVSKYGISCPHCSDGISYPNKFMFNLLKSIGVNFEPEKTFSWCKFPSYSDNTKLSYGRYDFVINDAMLIVEMDGGIGHGNKPYSNSRYSKEELIYRDNMKDKLAINNGYSVIRIDCDYSNREKFSYIKSSILNSDFVKYFDLRNIDWDDLNRQSLKSFMVEAIDMYNSGTIIEDIATKINKSEQTIKDYLTKGNELQMCIY